MSSLEKLLAKMRRSPKNIRLSEVKQVVKAFGFNHRAGGKHPNVYTREGYRGSLNFQERNGHVPAYQVRQLLGAIDEIQDPTE
ncbi:MAG: toxin HicA [Candidatus Eisenbacteria bacterium]|nr:toxin HicA [Candidatus Eisenbacteria bacterium]